MDANRFIARLYISPDAKWIDSSDIFLRTNSYYFEFTGLQKTYIHMYIADADDNFREMTKTPAFGYTFSEKTCFNYFCEHIVYGNNNKVYFELCKAIDEGMLPPDFDEKVLLEWAVNDAKLRLTKKGLEEWDWIQADKSPATEDKGKAGSQREPEQGNEHEVDVGVQSEQRKTEGLSDVEQRDSYITVPQFLDRYSIPDNIRETCARYIRDIAGKKAGDEKIVQIIETSDITSTSDNKGVRTKQNRSRKNKNAPIYRIQEQYLLEYRMKNGDSLLKRYKGTVP